MGVAMCRPRRRSGTAEVGASELWRLVHLFLLLA